MGGWDSHTHTYTPLCREGTTSTHLQDSTVRVCELSPFWPFATQQTVAHQAPLFMGVSRQEHWSGLPFTTPGDLSDPGIVPASPALAGWFFTTESLGSPHIRVLGPCHYRSSDAAKWTPPLLGAWEVPGTWPQRVAMDKVSWRWCDTMAMDDSGQAPLSFTRPPEVSSTLLLDAPERRPQLWELEPAQD